MINKKLKEIYGKGYASKQEFLLDSSIVISQVQEYLINSIKNMNHHDSLPVEDMIQRLGLHSSILYSMSQE